MVKTPLVIFEVVFEVVLHQGEAKHARIHKKYTLNDNRKKRDIKQKQNKKSIKFVNGS